MSLSATYAIAPLTGLLVGILFFVVLLKWVGQMDLLVKSFVDLASHREKHSLRAQKYYESPAFDAGYHEGYMQALEDVETRLHE